MSKKKCPKCSSKHTKKMESGEVNNAINVSIVITYLRTDGVID